MYFIKALIIRYLQIFCPLGILHSFLVLLQTFCLFKHYFLHCQTIYKQQFVMQHLKIAIPHRASILYCSTKCLPPFESQDSPCESVCHTYLKVSRGRIVPSNLENLTPNQQVPSSVYHPLESDWFLEDAVMQKRQRGCFLQRKFN